MFTEATIMAAGNISSLDSRVKSYVKNWETELSQKLEANKRKLVMCVPHERVGIKSKIETMSAVLERLQGKREIEIYCTGAAEMREEITSLKKKLDASENMQKDSVSRLQVANKIIRDLKLQLEQTRIKHFRSAAEAEKSLADLRQQLKEVRCSSAAMLSVETAINQDLKSKLEEAKKHLQQPLCQSAADAPTDVSELLQLQLHESTEELEKHACSMESSMQPVEIEEKLQVVITGMDIRPKLQQAQVKVMEKAQEIVSAAETDTPVSELQQKAAEEDDDEDDDEEEEPKPDLHNGEEKAVSFTISHLKTFFKSAASKAWKEQEAELRRQRVEISKLSAAVRCAEEQLEVQRQDSSKVLQEKEREWEQTFEEVSFQEEGTRRPRRRNWFLRIFTCVSPQISPQVYGRGEGGEGGREGYQVVPGGGISL